MEDETIPFHPLADLFPLIEGEQFRDLVEDIRENGLREPIVLLNGSILDGRNRARACHAAQVPARYITFDGVDPLSFVVSVNLRRRHLDASQRALVAAKLLREGPGRRGPMDALYVTVRSYKGQIYRYQKIPGTPHFKLPESRGAAEQLARKRIAELRPDLAARTLSVENAAAIMNVSSTPVTKARQVIATKSVALIGAVEKGALSIEAAAEIARLPNAEREAALASHTPSALRRMGKKIRQERLSARRSDRAANNASTKAVFDHVKLIDGRPIGNVVLGTIPDFIARAHQDARLLEAVLNHYSNADHGVTVREVFSERELSRVIALHHPRAHTS